MHGRACAHLCLLLAALAVVHGKQAPPRVRISDVSVAGVSSGGYMAVQYHVAFSAEIKACGVVAGGPFYCAKNNAEVALHACMVDPELIALGELYTAVEEMAAAGTIDPARGLKASKVWMFSGVNDTVVVQGVANKLEAFYRHYDADVVAVYDVSAEHSWPTSSFGNGCAFLGSPYINDCQYSASAAMMGAILGPILPAVPPVNSSLVAFDQAALIPGPFGPEKVGLAATAYAYVPQKCGDGSVPCHVHVVFHGCLQTLENVGTVFMTNTETNGIAEANNIVVLYPQAASNALNPKGCWDWWGYSGVTYPTKAGFQMATVHATLDAMRR